jgi:hypothetical protein
LEESGIPERIREPIMAIRVYRLTILSRESAMNTFTTSTSSPNDSSTADEAETLCR